MTDDALGAARAPRTDGPETLPALDEAALPEWRQSDALGAVIGARTAGSPISFDSDDLIAWIKAGACPDGEIRFAVGEFLMAMFACDARLLLIDGRVTEAELARFALHCGVGDKCALAPFLWISFPDLFPAPQEDRIRDKLDLQGFPEHECP